MKRGLIAVGLGLAVVGGTAWDALAGGPVEKPTGPARPCVAPVEMRVEDLDMSPDPVLEGQTLKSFTVILRSEQECGSMIEVRDQRGAVARTGAVVIHRGRDRYVVPAKPNYYASLGTHCFKVFALVRATPTASPTTTEVPTRGTFCAVKGDLEAAPGSSRAPSGSGTSSPGTSGPGSSRAPSSWNLKDNKKL